MLKKTKTLLSPFRRVIFRPNAKLFNSDRQIKSDSPEDLFHISGFREDQSTRVVKIVRPSQNPMQSNAKDDMWTIKWEIDDSEAWLDPLMAYAARSDPLVRGASGKSKMRFETFEEARDYIEKLGKNISSRNLIFEGFKWIVVDPVEFAGTEAKRYDDNYKYIPEEDEWVN